MDAISPEVPVSPGDVRRDNLAIEEFPEERLKRLGRMRPEKFESLTAEIGCCFSIVMSQVLTVWMPLSPSTVQITKSLSRSTSTPVL